MKYLNFIIVSMFVFFTTSCYEDFEKDFETTYTYFASQKPLRTLVADADMSIKVGVAFAGKREVNPNDWATFQIDNTLLDNYPDLELMPEKYYQLADKGKMTVTNPNLAIADVEVTFSDEFYNDNAALNKYYAIPFRITGHNQEEIAKDANGNLKDYSIVVVKFVSKYHGIYYRRGKKTNLTDGSVTEYYNKDLSQNEVVSFNSLGRYEVQRPGFDVLNDTGMSINLKVNENGSVDITAGGSVPIYDAIAVLETDSESLEFTGEQPKFVLRYKYQKDGVEYLVEEELIRRQNPEDDLRFQEW